MRGECVMAFIKSVSVHLFPIAKEQCRDWFDGFPHLRVSRAFISSRRERSNTHEPAGLGFMRATRATQRTCFPLDAHIRLDTGRSNNPRILTRILTSSTKKKHSCLIELIDSIFVLIYTIQYSLFFNILTFDKILIIVASKNLRPTIESLSIISSPKISPQISFSTPRAWNGK